MAELHKEGRQDTPKLVSIEGRCKTSGGEIIPPGPAEDIKFSEGYGGRGRSIGRPDEAEWLAGAVRDSNGNALANVANVLLSFEQAPQLRGALRFDEMERQVMVCRPLPDIDGELPRRFGDVDAIALQVWLQRRGLPRIGAEAVHQAAHKAAWFHRFHPIRDYLSRLRWDGTPRLNSFFADYFGAEPGEYASGIGRMLLISMVTRIYRPGCKFDNMVILEGEQGIRKSTACRVLAGEQWFSDSLPDFHTKEASQHLRGKWLVEVAELAAMRKSESDDLKVFVSRQGEKYRPPYGRGEVIEPRQCVLIGTTNDEQYLQDETGSRRFWPIKCGRLDIDTLCGDRDQLFAEAVEAYEAGEQWWPEPDFERNIIKPQQDARYKEDAWVDAVAIYVATQSRTTVGQIATEGLGFPLKDFKRPDELRISRILKELKWTSRRTGKARFYYPTEDVASHGEEE